MAISGGLFGSTVTTVFIKGGAQGPTTTTTTTTAAPTTTTTTTAAPTTTTSTTTAAPTTTTTTTAAPTTTTTTAAPTTTTTTTAAPTTTTTTAAPTTTTTTTTAAPTTTTTTATPTTTTTTTTTAPTTTSTTTTTTTTSPYSNRFSPVCLGNRFLWLDANHSASIVETSGAISKWSDISGADNDLEQDTASARPSVSSSTLNSLPLVEFDGTEFLSRSTFAHPTAATWFMVLEADTVNHNGDAAFSYNYNTNAQYYNIAANNSTEWRPAWMDYLIKNGDVGESDFGETSNVTGFHLYGFEINGTTTNGFKNFFDGEQENTWTPYDSIDSGGVLRLMADSNAASNLLEGKVAEVLMFNAVLSTSERQKVEGYLAHKWGLTGRLPATHPYKTSQAAGCYHGDPCILSPYCHTYEDASDNTISVQFDIKDAADWIHYDIGATSYTVPTWDTTVTSGTATVSLSVEAVTSNPLSTSVKYTLSRSGLADLIWYAGPGDCLGDTEPTICDCGTVCTSTSTTTTAAPTTTTSTTPAPTTTTTPEPTTTTTTTTTTTAAPTTTTTSTTSSTSSTSSTTSSSTTSSTSTTTPAGTTTSTSSTTTSTSTTTTP